MKNRIVSAGLLIIVYASNLGAQSTNWSDGQDADRVIGQADFVTGEAGLDAESFWGPSDVAVDPTTGKIFVCDKQNSRILRFSSYETSFDGATAEAVFGADDFTSQNFQLGANRMNRPNGIFVDFAGRLWVSDSGNGRLLRFDDASAKPTGASADGLLGKPDFSTPGFGLSINRMSVTYDVTGDVNGTIWIADTGNFRVLRFDNAASKGNGADADGVLGQPDFDTAVAGSGIGEFQNVLSIAVTPGGSLFTADASNYRVYRFDGATSKSGVAVPDAVIGQDAFDGSTFFGAARNALRSPSGLAYSSLNDTLFVCEEQGNRIVVIENVSMKTGRVDADALLGQDMADLRDPGLAVDRLSLPQRTCADQFGRLYAADSVNARVVRFSPASHQRFKDVQPDLTIGTTPGAQIGNDIHNSRPAVQTTTANPRKGRPVTFFANLQNDGFARVDYFIQGSRGNRFSRVRYQAISGPGGNITASMIRGTAATGVMEKEEAYALRARLSPSKQALAKRKVLQVSITGRDPRRSSIDGVTGRLKVR